VTPARNRSLRMRGESFPLKTRQAIAASPQQAGEAGKPKERGDCRGYASLEY